MRRRSSAAVLRQRAGADHDPHARSAGSSSWVSVTSAGRDGAGAPCSRTRRMGRARAGCSAPAARARAAWLRPAAGDARRGQLAALLARQMVEDRARMAQMVEVAAAQGAADGVEQERVRPADPGRGRAQILQEQAQAAPLAGVTLSGHARPPSRPTLLKPILTRPGGQVNRRAVPALRPWRAIRRGVRPASG